MSGEGAILGADEWPGGLDDELNVIERADVRKADDEKKRRRQVEQILRDRMAAYRRVFVDGKSTAGDRQIVINDLANFCRKKRSTADADTHIAARLDGRREVVLRIDEYLELTLQELIELKVPDLKGED